MQELKQLREASSSDTDDSSMESQGAIGSRRKCHNTKKNRRRQPSNHSSEVAALQQEIAKLKCTQDQMERYQLSLEREYRNLQRQLLATDFSRQMAEMKNKELQQEIRDIVEDQLRFDNRIIHGVKPMDQKEHDFFGEIGMLHIENRILRQKLERCEQTLLENSQQKLDNVSAWNIHFIPFFAVI